MKVRGNDVWGTKGMKFRTFLGEIGTKLPTHAPFIYNFIADLTFSIVYIFWIENKF